MHYREAPPRRWLGRYIERFWFRSGEAGLPAEPQRILPDGCMETN
jgi:hypothetical protein